jgi:hypothetical protein
LFLNYNKNAIISKYIIQEREMKKREKKRKAAKVVTEAHLKKKRRRKKIFLSIFNILLLLTVGFLIFFFGWVHPDVEPGECVVIFTKTSGFEPEVYEPGEFKWMWQGIIPKNRKYYKYKITPEMVHIKAEEKLPSGDVYSTILNTNPDFSYDIELEIYYRLNKERLVQLSESLDGKQENVDELYTQFSNTSKTSLPGFLIKKSADIDFLKMGITEPEKLGEELKLYIAEQEYSSYFSIERVVPIKLNVPDLELYTQARETYLNLIKVSPEEALKNMQNYASYKILKDTQIEGIEKLGKLLNDYPALLKYFEIYANSEKDFEILKPVFEASNF